MKSSVELWIFSLFLVVLMSTISIGQDTPPETEEVDRERVIVNLEQLEASSIAQTVAQLSSRATRVFPETASNRLIIDGPKSDVATIVALVRELDRPIQQVKVRLVEVAIQLGVEDEVMSGPTDDVQKKVAGLLKAGKAKVTDKISVEVGNNTTARASIGARKPSVTGGSSKGKTYSFNEVGTVFDCTPRVGTDAVLLQYTYEKSAVVDGEEGTPSSFKSWQSNSIIRIPKGQSIVMSGRHIGPDAKPVAWKIILSAEVTGK